MTEKLVISNINQFMGFANKNQGLLNVGGFAFLRGYLNTGATCGKCSKASSKLSELRPQWEASFAVLSPSEKTLLKNLLDTKQLCYYARQPNGQLKINCF